MSNLALTVVMLNYDLWLERVNEILDGAFGLTTSNIPYRDWRADWSEGLEPTESVVRFVTEMTD